jgi:hypothetical protein
MFIGEISKTIRREVVYPYLDEDGEYQESAFYIWIKRLSFRERTGKEFKEQFDAIVKDEAKLAKAAAPLIDKWDLFSKEVETYEDKEKYRIPVSVEFLQEQDAIFVVKIAEAVFTALAEAQDPKKMPATSANGSELTENAEIQTQS